MANSLEPDQSASEADLSGSALFAKAGYILSPQEKEYLGHKHEKRSFQHIETTLEIGSYLP